jgi:4-oxalocrotonate tautomerase
MPLIEVHLIEKVFGPEQKRQIIQKLTDAMVSIEGENMRRDLGEDFGSGQR